MVNQTVLYIYSDVCAVDTLIQIKNYTLKGNKYNGIVDTTTMSMIKIQISHHRVTLILSNCAFADNNLLLLLSVDIYERDLCWESINLSCNFLSSILITKSSFVNNNWTLMQLLSSETLTCVKVHITGPIDLVGSNIQVFKGITKIMRVENFIIHVNGPIYISRNSADFIMSIYSSFIYFNGLINVSKNKVNIAIDIHSSSVLFNGPIIMSRNTGSIIHTQSCNVTLNGPITISNNWLCEYVMQLQYSDIMLNRSILFKSNMCHHTISIKSNKETAYIKVGQDSNITFTENYISNPKLLKLILIIIISIPFVSFSLFISIQNVSAILPSDNTMIIIDSFLYDYCKLPFYHLMSHCKWIPTATYYGLDPGIINQQVLQLDPNFQHSTIFYCSNFSTDAFRPVYPGQMLQAELCMPCSDDNSILYAETQNTFLPNSACKIAHQTELVNVITNNSKMVSYTIVSEANESCELFLTVSPFLYYIYEVFDVQLLPCPIGFTLQNGVCDCDPLLPTDIDTCYIDQSAIRRPANTWISYTQSGTSKYLISDCPMDYCLPFSSNINLLHPDTQCQFSRTGILCSQCQHHLSMVFGLSRCMKCTNVYILITIVVIVAGIVLVVLLYFLNLTVTKATINGIIIYASIIGINNSAFLINDSVFKPLQVFISFTNLDLGTEICFYNGMDGYTKTWLQLCFPVYLIFIAFSIIIASRYSSRILRLTYSRSLPVLATLFLLSYTGVLRTVLTVLFSYSTITDVPSGHQELVWSVDASVPLFGLKFTILFITCLVTRYLARFKLIYRFKPILDAFQGSYKDRYYYWLQYISC